MIINQLLALPLAALGVSRGYIPPKALFLSIFIYEFKNLSKKLAKLHI